MKSSTEDFIECKAQRCTLKTEHCNYDANYEKATVKEITFVT